VLFGFRLRLLTLAEEFGIVSAAWRQMGFDRSTDYRSRAESTRWGLEEPMGLRKIG
jgi:hypothetical protein